MFKGRDSGRGQQGRTGERDGAAGWDSRTGQRYRIAGWDSGTGQRDGTSVVAVHVVDAVAPCSGTKQQE